MVKNNKSNGSNAYIVMLIYSFAFWSKPEKTKQIVVALFATTLKALFSVTKTNSRLSWHKLYAGNIYYLFLNILVHIYPLSDIKKCAPKGTHRKNASPRMLLHKLSPIRYEKREKTLFTKVFSRIREKICSLCSTNIVPHFTQFVNKAWNFEKILLVR